VPLVLPIAMSDMGLSPREERRILAPPPSSCGLTAPTGSDIRFCEGFRMPAVDSGGTGYGGRRPKASKGRNRDGERMAVARALWGFGRSG
jgi:hypothetical protein